MGTCISDKATKTELEHIAQILAQREANKPTFESFEYCEECGEEIPEKRRQFAKGITRCVDCQEIIEIKRGKR